MNVRHHQEINKRFLNPLPFRQIKGLRYLIAPQAIEFPFAALGFGKVRDGLHRSDNDMLPPGVIQGAAS